MGLTVLEDNGFAGALEKAGDRLVVVDFFAVWCGPCKRLTPQMEMLATKETNVLFYKLDVDTNPKVVAKYGISAMPTIMFFKNGSKVHEVIGADFKRVAAGVAEHKN